MSDTYYGSGRPKTIDELKIWYKRRNLPPEEKTRFFVGKNVNEPKAFSIYEEDGVYTVCKNRADGMRVVRYEGTDEEFAVNEFYERLKKEIKHQKFLNKDAKKNAKAAQITKNTIFGIIFASIAGLIVALGVRGCKNEKLKGYYKYDNAVYYRTSSGLWFVYDAVRSDYNKVSDVPEELSENMNSFREKQSDYEKSAYDFYETDAGKAYQEQQSSQNDDDSDYNWDSGDSWDSGGTDWDSDW